MGFDRDSWVTPVDARRVEPEDDANRVAAEQGRTHLHRLPDRDDAPMFVFDAGYDPVRLQQGLEGCCGQILVRLNSARDFYFDPEPLPKRPVGLPCAVRDAPNATRRSRRPRKTSTDDGHTALGRAEQPLNTLRKLNWKLRGPEIREVENRATNLRAAPE